MHLVTTALRQAIAVSVARAVNPAPEASAALLDDAFAVSGPSTREGHAFYEALMEQLELESDGGRALPAVERWKRLKAARGRVCAAELAHRARMNASRGRRLPPRSAPTRAHMRTPRARTRQASAQRPAAAATGDPDPEPERLRLPAVAGGAA